MAYEPNLRRGPIRDQSYPSEIAALRPIGATRIHCVDEPEDEASAMRGDESDDRCAEFNKRLRSGR